MFELAVAAANGDLMPSVFLDQPNDLTDLHGAGLVADEPDELLAFAADTASSRVG